jgi:hypothetical protein
MGRVRELKARVKVLQGVIGEILKADEDMTVGELRELLRCVLTEPKGIRRGTARGRIQ